MRLPTSLVPSGRGGLAPLLVALGIVGASPAAFAQGATACPPGAWFCADVGAPAGSAKPHDPPAADEKKAGAPGTEAGGATSITIPPNQGGTTIIVNTAPAAPPAPPPPVVKAAPPPAHVVAPPPRYEPAPLPPPRPRRSEWGFNMHLEGAMMGSRGDQQSSDGGMGGMGFSLRARPTGYFALDLGLDFLGGRDYQGYRRSEVPFTVNGLIFVNPRSKTQFYFLGGLGWSNAHVQLGNTQVAQYSYFGVQGGVGLEFRVAPHVAFNIDAIGFIRGRTDDAAATTPEFVDPNTGRSTNSSGGGLFRGGMTLYW